jgi:hypothetical protein
MKSKIKINGRFKAWLHKANGLVIPVADEYNTIHSALLQAFPTSWESSLVDYALDDLFTGASGQELGKDGIFLRTGGGGTISNITMETTSITPAETHGSRWEAEFTFASPFTLVAAHLGHDHQGGAGLGPWFEVTYATNSLPNIEVANLDRFVVDWEIYT